MAERSDAELLLAYRDEEDFSAFETLVRRYEHELYGYLRGYLGGAEAAEDVFQQTFLQVHVKSEMFDESRPFRPWLYTIATNSAIDYQRRSKRHRMMSLDRGPGGQDEPGRGAVDDLQSDDVTPVDEFLAQESRTAVQAAVEALPDASREIILLVYFQGLKYREAADVLGVPVGTAKSRAHTAVKQLGALLESYSRSS